MHKFVPGITTEQLKKAENLLGQLGPVQEIYIFLRGHVSFVIESTVCFVQAGLVTTPITRWVTTCPKKVSNQKILFCTFNKGQLLQNPTIKHKNPYLSINLSTSLFLTLNIFLLLR